jgi:biotin synthase
MGESIEDRAGMLALSTLNPQPESVPINALVAVEHSYGRGKPVEIWEMIRMVYKNHHARNSSAFISRENEHES